VNAATIDIDAGYSIATAIKKAVTQNTDRSGVNRVNSRKLNGRFAIANTVFIFSFIHGDQH